VKKSVYFDNHVDVSNDVVEDEECQSGDDSDVSKYELVKVSGKRKMSAEFPLDDATFDLSKKRPKIKTRFNTMTRCSLKELASCISLLKDRHLTVLRSVDLGNLKHFKIKSNINKQLICFLMYRIDADTMTLDLGAGNKMLKITAEGIRKRATI